MSRSDPLWSLVAFVLLAGCAGGVAGSVPAGFEEAADGLAVLDGVVMDEELRPIPAALVSVDRNQNVLTGDDGWFRVVDVTPGPHAVEVNAPGFAPQGRTLDAIVDQAPHAQFVLVALASDQPYRELLLHTGFEACGFAAGVSGGTGESLQNTYGVPCQFGKPATSFRVEVKETWQYLVMEMDWQTRDNMWFLATHAAGHCATGGTDVCWGQSMGTSPLRIEGAPGSLNHAKRYALDGKKTFPTTNFTLFADATYLGMFRDEINRTAGPQCVTLIRTTLGPLGQSWNENLGCGLGYGYSTGFKINYYISIFHYARPPDPSAYSGRPDK